MTAATTSTTSTGVAPLLRRRPAAVDGEHGAGDVAGGVRGQVQAGFGDVGDVAGTADRDAVLEEMTAELGHALADRRVDGAGRDHVDADLVLDQLHRRRPGERVEAALGGDVRR